MVNHKDKLRLIPKTYRRQVFIFLSLIGAFSLFGYFLYYLSNKSNRPNFRLAQLEDDYKEELKTTVRNKFGRAIYSQINPDLHSIDSDQSDIIKQLLSECSSNDNFLKYLLHATLGMYSLKNENEKNAIANFKSALVFNPDSIICLTWLAETYELVGDAENALAIYKRALMLSPSIKRYFSKQIDIVENKGPRKKPPVTGFRYMAY